MATSPMPISMRRTLSSISLSAHGGCLGQPGNALQENVPAAEHVDDQRSSISLAHDDAIHLLEDPINQSALLMDLLGYDVNIQTRFHAFTFASAPSPRPETSLPRLGKGSAVAIPIRPAGMYQLIRGKWTGSPQPKYRPPLEALSKRVSDRLLPRRRPGPLCGLMKVEALCVVQRSVGNAMVGGRAEISVR